MAVHKPKEFDRYIVQPVINYAAQKALVQRKDYYVVADVDGFRCVQTQPSPQRSHWKLDSTAELTMHLGGAEITDYNYENIVG